MRYVLLALALGTPIADASDTSWMRSPKKMSLSKPQAPNLKKVIEKGTKTLKIGQEKTARTLKTAKVPKATAGSLETPDHSAEGRHLANSGICADPSAYTGSAQPSIWGGEVLGILRSTLPSSRAPRQLLDFAEIPHAQVKNNSHFSSTPHTHQSIEPLGYSCDDIMNANTLWDSSAPCTSTIVDVDADTPSRKWTMQMAQLCCSDQASVCDADRSSTCTTSSAWTPSKKLTVDSCELDAYVDNGFCDGNYYTCDGYAWQMDFEYELFGSDQCDTVSECG